MTDKQAPDSIETKAQLEDLVVDKVGSHYGLTDVKDIGARLKSLEEAKKAAIEEEAVDKRQERVRAGDSLTWDPENRSHPYYAKAAHIINNDQVNFKVNGQSKSIDAYGRGLRAARLIRANLEARRQNIPVEEQLKRWGDDWMVEELERAKPALVERNLQLGNAVTGGLLVPEEYMNEMVELLRPMVRVRAAGPRQIRVPTGAVRMNRKTAGTSFQFIGEQQNIVPSDVNFGDLSLNCRQAAGGVAISNTLLRSADVSVDALVRDDLLEAYAVFEDQAFLRGAGTQYAPLGIRNLPLTANVLTSAGSTTQNKIADFLALMNALVNADVPMLRPHLFMSPRTMHALMFEWDANGAGWVFREEMASGALFGIPFSDTTSVPINLGGGSDESEIILADMADIVVADQYAPIVETFPGAAYHDGTQVQSGVSRDETFIRALASIDIGARRRESIARLDAVAY